MAADMNLPASWRSRRAMVFWAGIVVVLGMIAFLGLQPGPTGAAKAGAGEQSAVIQPKPFAATISVVGTVTPGDVVAVSAPFDGVVRSLRFTYGDPVAQGQVLAVLDTTEIDHRRNEARAEFLKASQAASDMAGWASGPEVSQARRAEAQAAADLKDTERKTAETKGLLDRGLVARDEYEGALQQARSQRMGLAAARQDLASALKRGEGSNRRVTAIELGNASGRLAEVEAQRAGAVVRAPASGVMVHPPSDKGDAPGPGPHAGGPVTKGQLIGAVARPGGLAVAFQLSEADANRVRP
ncbi:MAG: biotin/lipoyl-binding protein, partial [Caulobacteraceae bacterium]|nr:biotin/lipoyl-binding protein [Caulobacteraceae bacterium]